MFVNTAVPSAGISVFCHLRLYNTFLARKAGRRHAFYSKAVKSVQQGGFTALLHRACASRRRRAASLHTISVKHLS